MLTAMASCRRDRACVAGWLALLSCLLVITPSAQPLGSILGPTADGTAGSAAECSLYLLGGEKRIRGAGMRCTGPQPTILIAATHLKGFEANSTGVRFTNTSSCSAMDTICLVTICSGSLVLRRSRVLWVRGLADTFESGLCVIGDSRLEVHNSRFSFNTIRPLSVFEGAHLVLHASNVSYNLVEGSGGGLWADDHTNVTITGGSRVHGNRVSADGGGLLVWGQAHLVLNASTISNNSANAALGSGGGLWAGDSANITITGGSRVHHNTAVEDGGGLFVGDNTTVTFTGRSYVHSNKVMRWGGGLSVAGNAVVALTGGSSVHSNTAWIGSGGGLSVGGNAAVTITGSSVVRNNTAGAGGGGGLRVFGSANVTLTGGSRVWNSTAWAGGGLEVKVIANVTLTDHSSVHNNTATQAGGGLLVGDNSTVTLIGGSSVHHNQVLNGGGGGLAMVGHAYGASNSTLTLTDGSSVHHNWARNGTGGGLDVLGGAVVTIGGHSTVVNNTCVGGVGGGIAVDQRRRNDTGGRAVEMNPDKPQSFDSRGGRPLEDISHKAGLGFKSRVTISNSTVANNTSVGYPGGGLAVGGEGGVELENSTKVSHNAAVRSSGGEAVLVGNATLRFAHGVLFDANSVSSGYVGSTIAAFDKSTLHLPSHGELTRCSVGVYLGQSSPCQAGEVPLNDMCMCCQRHTFNFEANATCEPCPPNANCPGGSIVEPLAGYWQSVPTSAQMHHCPWSTDACKYASPEHQCKKGFTGPLCGVCQRPHYGMQSPLWCAKCMQSKGLQLGLYILVSFVSVVFVAYTVHATWRDNLVGTGGVRATDLIKALVLFAQYTVIIGGVSVPWPVLSMRRWFQAAGIVFGMASSQTVSLDCWLYAYPISSKLPIAYQRQLVYFLAPVFVLMAVVALQWLAWAVKRWVMPLVWRRPQERTGRLQPALLVVRKLPVTLLVLTFYAYPTLLRASLSFFACLRIDKLTVVSGQRVAPGGPGATAPLSHEHGYWVSNITQECFADSHTKWALAMGMPAVLLWCVAVPVAMGLGLFLCRGKADTESFREHFGFLYRNYRPERMWWEAVWAARTVVLSLISVFTFPMQRYFSVLALLAVFWASAILQNVFKPYASQELHGMHMVLTSCLAATTVGALVMLAYDIDQDSQTAQNLRIVIAALVLLVNVLVVAWCMWKLLPVLKEWCAIAYKRVKSWVLWVVDAVLVCAGHQQAVRGKGRRRGGAAGRV